MDALGARLWKVIGGLLVALGVVGLASACLPVARAGGPDRPAPPAQREVHSPVAGAWWVEELPGFLYAFDDDGTGTRGTSESSETFGWAVTDQQTLEIVRSRTPEGEPRHERWSFALDGDALTLTSLQVDGVGQTLARIDLDHDALVGAWAWDQDPTWRYTFRAGGAATRGREHGPEFRWFVSGDRLLFTNSGHTERWDFVLDGDTLQLVSPSGDEQYTYRRLAG